MRKTLLFAFTLLAACQGSNSGTANAGTLPDGGVIQSQGVKAPAGFFSETIGSVSAARELAALPNGDLLVATDGTSIYLIAGAEADAGVPLAAPVKYLDIPDGPSQGITFEPQSSTIYFASQHGVWSLPWVAGQAAGTPVQVASVRTGPIAPNSDGDVHITSSVAFANGHLYVAVGSSCNACTETDPTRAVILEMNPDGSSVTTKATRIRNAIALATNPATNTVWAGGAGQDNLPLGHPYEFFDSVTLHAGTGTANYGWPACEENQHAYVAGSDCSNTVAPLVALPAYSSWIGAVFYPATQTGTYAFPSANRGLYLAGHGSWHTINGAYFTPPRVAFVPLAGDAPATAVNWSDPSTQWTEFLGGFQLSDGVTRIGRPTGIAVGAQGSLFVADDTANQVYRVRPR
jgi:glucose/arabinose dehydrogenase